MGINMNRQRITARILVAVFAALLMVQATAVAEVSRLWINQIVQHGNNVYLYVSALSNSKRLSNDNLNAEQFSVSPGTSVALRVEEASRFSATKEALSYTFCVDISKSVTSNEMSDIKEGLKNLVSNMNQNDWGRLITIGSEVTELCPFTQSKSALNSAIDNIKRNANKTYLYRGLELALTGYRTSGGSLPNRNVILLFSDGMDDSDGADTMDGIIDILGGVRVPVYVVGVKGNDSKASLGDVGRIARISGGDIYSYSDYSVREAVQVFDQVIRGSYRLCVVPNDDLFGQSNIQWVAHYGTLDSQQYSYSLSLEGVVISTPSPSPTPTPTPTPTPIPTPDTDATLVLSDNETELIEAAPSATPIPIADLVVQFMNDYFFIIIAAVLMIIALIIMLVILKKNRGKRSLTNPPDPMPKPVPHIPPEEETKDDELTTDGELEKGDSDDETTTDDALNDGVRMRLTITFDGKVDVIERRFGNLDNRLVLGRNTKESTCDVDVVLGSKINDAKRTGRKHAALINRADGIYVEDLNSKNKTYVNGSEVQGEMPIRNGDVLLLGGAQVKVEILF